MYQIVRIGADGLVTFLYTYGALVIAAGWYFQLPTGQHKGLSPYGTQVEGRGHILKSQQEVRSPEKGKFASEAWGQSPI